MVDGLFVSKASVLPLAMTFMYSFQWKQNNKQQNPRTVHSRIEKWAFPELNKGNCLLTYEVIHSFPEASNVSPLLLACYD